MPGPKIRTARLCLGNSWARPVNGDFHFAWLLRLMGSISPRPDPISR